MTQRRLEGCTFAVMREYSVYILRCRDGSYYTGVTQDVQRRVEEHWFTSDPASYLYKRRPVELVHLEAFQDIRDAITREKQIKRWSRKKKEALMQGNNRLLSQYSKRKAVMLRGSPFSPITSPDSPAHPTPSPPF